MSYRNNQDRVGAPLTAQDPAPQEQVKEEGFSYAMPTEVVDLPSKGQFYPPEHPLYGVTSIEIKHMTAKEEDILTSVTLLKKGLALDRMLKSIILDKRVSSEDLLVGDKNALVVAARINAYGSEYSTTVACPGCSTSSTHNFNLDELVNTFPEEEDFMLYDADNEDGRFFINLPKSNVRVGIHMLCGADEKKMLAMSERKKRMRLPESALTDQLKMIVETIDGDEDKKSISQFIDTMPASDSRHLRVAYAALTPNVDLKQTFECEACGFAEEVDIPLTADFFWPR